jgi:hypothetical protein
MGLLKSTRRQHTISKIFLERKGHVKRVSLLPLASSKAEDAEKEEQKEFQKLLD